MTSSDPLPPDNCTCASFFTVRGTHKKDCPLYKNSQELDSSAGVSGKDYMVDQELRVHLRLLYWRGINDGKEHRNEDKFVDETLKEIRDYIQSQRHKLLDEIEERGPKDVEVLGLDNYASGENATNAQWRSLIKELRSE